MLLDDAMRLAVLRRTALGAHAEPAFDRLARMVRRQLDVPVALVSLVDDSRQFFPGQVGLDGVWAACRQTPLDHSFCQHVVTTEKPLVVVDARLDPLLADNLAVSALGVVGYLGMPLTDAVGTVMGSLCAISPEPREWTQDDVDAMADLAESCSSELQLRLSAASSTAALDRVSLLSEVTRAVGTLDGEVALTRLTRLMVPGLADWCTVGLVDETGRVRTSQGRHADEDKVHLVARFCVQQAQVSDASSASRVVLRTGEAMVIQGADALLGHGGTELPAGLDATSVLVVPLRARQGAIGYLTLGRGAARGPYDAGDLNDALDIGRRAGLALDNAELFRRQRDVAVLLQRDMLTRLPEPDHLHVVARYVPAGDAVQVGGDWYDALLQPDGATVLVVGDVMGHDMTAAAMMGQLRSLVRGIAYDRDEAPAAVLSRVDRTMAGLEVDTLATVVIARIEQTAEDAAAGLRRLRWSSAGHPPPVLVSPDGTVTVLDTPGELLLGIDPASPRTDHEVALPAGSTVLMFTDGLVERRDLPLEEGVARLCEALQDLAGTPMDALCDAVLARVLPHGSEDDVAVLALHCYDQRLPRPVEAGPVRIPTQP